MNHCQCFKHDETPASLKAGNDIKLTYFPSYMRTETSPGQKVESTENYFLYLILFQNYASAWLVELESYTCRGKEESLTWEI